MNNQKYLRTFLCLSACLCLLLTLLSGCTEPSASTPPITQPTTNPIVEPTTPPTDPTEPTTPPTDPTTPPQPTDPEPDPFPAELADNVYLSMKGTGYCEQMTGDVMVTVIFLSDSISSWTADGIAEAKAFLDEDIPKLEDDAARYGAELNVEITYLESKILMAQDPGDQLLFWAKTALDKHGLSQALSDPTYLEKHYNVDSAPVVFVLNREGRPYAITNTTGEETFEYVVMYSSAYVSIRHELCHTHGAMDFYFPQETVDAANQYLSESLMLNSANGSVDDLTAYLIGWTDTLLPNAEAFLRAVNHLTQADIVESNQENMMTGYGTKEFNGCTYTGYLLSGLPHGEGTCVWDVGVVYTGQWTNGKRNGYGEQTEANGTVYKGEWVNDMIQGQGTVIYASGEVYSGEWKNGVMDGQGTYTWNNGVTYTGGWVNGKRTGYGVLIYADGSRHEGEFYNNKRHGEGTYYDADGNIKQQGVWENDTFKKS